MELEVFEGQNKNELSMIEVAHAILAKRGDVMPFADLANDVQEYLSDSNKEIRERLAQFYTDLNIDGSFISLGDNLWGLRTWYPYDSIDEATVHMDGADEDRPKAKKSRKVNAFLVDASDDDDVIDYDADDPEDQEFVDNEGIAEDHEGDLGKYSSDIKEVDDSPDDEDDQEMPDGIEGELTDLGENESLLDDQNDNDADLSASHYDNGSDDYDYGIDD